MQVGSILFELASSYHDEANSPRFSIKGERLAPFNLASFS